MQHKPQSIIYMFILWLEPMTLPMPLLSHTMMASHSVFFNYCLLKVFSPYHLWSTKLLYKHSSLIYAPSTHTLNIFLLLNGLKYFFSIFPLLLIHFQIKLCFTLPFLPFVGTQLHSTLFLGKYHQMRFLFQAESDVESDVSQSDGKNLSSRGGTDSPQPNVSNGRSTSDPETQQLGSSDLAT